MKPFRDPDETIGNLDPITAATLVATSADVALVLDRDGVIQDMSVQAPDLSLELEGFGRWLGRPWSDTVSPASQRKVETLLQEADTRTASQWRQLTHQTVTGRDLPILYSAVKLGPNGRIVALGRDLRAVSALQQRLVDAQMSMERDYAKLRFAETRYRLLFQTSSEPVLIVDAATQKIVEANPAAAALIEERGGQRMVGRPFAELFAEAARPRVLAALGELRGTPRTEDIDAVLDNGGAVGVRASSYRQEGAAMVLVRLVPVASAPGATAALEPAERRMLDFVDVSPDAFVLADASGTVLSANASFAAMVQSPGAGSLQGRPMEQWFGRPGVDLDVVMANLRQHGIVRLYATTLRGEAGATLDVETSAVALGRGKAASFGFAIRDVGRRLNPQASRELPRSADQLTEMIGRVPLKELVRETTDVIEKLCIEAALALTGDNRASAAELLGLSRQSLYVKLRRYGLAEPDLEEDA